jgi:hypothetical protein
MRYIYHKATKQAQREQPSSEATSLTPIRFNPQTAIRKITNFQEKLLEIQANINSQITILDDAARLLNVQNDRLHPLVHCKHILQLDISSVLQGLLQAIADKIPEGQGAMREHNTAIWLESRILAVQLWVVKRLLPRIQSLKTEDRALHVQIQKSLRDAAMQIHNMSMTLAALRDIPHRMRLNRAEESPREEWPENSFLKDTTSADLNNPMSELTSQSSQSSE